ncbi:phenylalanine--tRNA ligase subunit beta [Candidatus Gracilibacteria bacterium]|nr:phenylalanine--tRNA ligase subunit beta [Candidatus Gracilibacteria bacterium]
MKVSYKVLKKYIPDIKSPEEVAQDLIMHTAEVEEMHSQKKDFENIVYGKITSVIPHDNADSLRVCMVDIGEESDTQIVCGGSNLQVGQGVAIAKIGASVLWHGQGDPVIMKKTAIRGVESSGMICAAEEIGLKDEFPAKTETEIIDLTHLQAKPGTPLDEVLGKDDIILEIDNKAINHRPDLFSHIGIAREVSAIAGKKLDYEHAQRNFSNLNEFSIQNDIQNEVKRYMGIKVSGVQNIQSPDYIKEVLQSQGVESKGLLVDITNYSLYLYGQPTHCFDADTIKGDMHIRFARDGEQFEALNGKSYTLSSSDIVIADEINILALGGVIGGKASAVSDTTSNIIIESAWFDQAILRQTGKRLGLRTDALNVFEKDLIVDLRDIGPSLIIQELEKHLPNMKLEAFKDVYPTKESTVTIPYNGEFISMLLGKEYSKDQIVEILSRVGIELEGEMLLPPSWRKDLTNIADIAEEVARLDGYGKIEMTIPRINIGAVTQSPLYKARRDVRNYLVSDGFFELYTYSFTNKTVIEKALGDIETHIPLKNYLSEELSHMRAMLIPNLLQALEDNSREFKNLKLFECEKVFHTSGTDSISENYELGLIEQSHTENAYYSIQNTLNDIFAKLGVLSHSLESTNEIPHFAHGGRTAQVIVRGKTVGYIGEIHPKAAKNFGATGRIGFITLDMSALEPAFYGLVSAKEISNFQQNNFDLNFVVDTQTPGKKIQTAISKTDALIQKVELKDIYESQEKLPGKRSLTFKIYIQSDLETLSDSIKNTLIEKIIDKVSKVGGTLR